MGDNLRDFKTILTSHPGWVILSFVLSLLGLIFVTIDLHDKMGWNVL